MFPTLVLLLMHCFWQMHPFQIPFQNPARLQSILIPGRALKCLLILSAFYGLCCTYLFLYRTSDVFQHFLRIITSAGPQDRKDHTQYLAGYHNQRLHLFERIIRPCRVIYMQFLKFLCMGYRSLRFPMPYCNHGLSASLHARSPGFPLPPGG